MHFYLCPPKVDLRAFLVTKEVIPLHLQYEGSSCVEDRVVSFLKATTLLGYVGYVRIKGLHPLAHRLLFRWLVHGHKKDT
jgi:hypothetical protein